MMSPKYLILLTIWLLFCNLTSETIFFKETIEIVRNICNKQLLEALKGNIKINDFNLLPILKAWKTNKLPIDEQNFNEQLNSLLSKNLELQESYQQYTLGLALEIDQLFQTEINYLESLNENLSKALALLQNVPQLQKEHFNLVLNSNSISSRKWKKIRKLQLPEKIESNLETFYALQEISDSPTDKETSEFVLKVLNSSENGRQLWYKFLQYYYDFLQQAYKIIQKIKELER